MADQAQPELARSHIPRSGCRRRHPGCCPITFVSGNIAHHGWMPPARTPQCRRRPVAGYQATSGTRADSRCHIRTAARSRRREHAGLGAAAGRTHRFGAPPGRRSGDELRGFRVDGDVPAEQHAFPLHRDDRATPAKIIASAPGHTDLPGPGAGHAGLRIRARNSVPDAGLSDVLTPRRQGVFLRLYSSTAGASRTASLAFCSSESGGGRWASLRRYSSWLVPVQPLLAGLGNLAPGHHQVPCTG